MVFVGAMLFGIAFALMSIALPLYVRKVAGAKHFGSVYSVVSSVGNVASAVSGPIYGAIYEISFDSNMGDYCRHKKSLEKRIIFLWKLLMNKKIDKEIR